MAKIDTAELDTRIWHWAAWCIKFEQNLFGWPEESTLYKFYREGFSNDNNRNRTSSEPYRSHPEAEHIQRIFNQLKKEDHDKAHTLYVYYVHNVSIRRIAEAEKINWRSVYKRIEAAKHYIAKELGLYESCY